MNGSDVLPVLAPHDVSNRAATDTELRSDLFGGDAIAGHRSYLMDLCLGEFGAGQLSARHHATAGDSIPSIVGMSSDVEMRWPDASRVIAMVEDPHAIGNWPIGEQPRDAMRRFQSPLVYDHSVTERTRATTQIATESSTSPLPAIAGRINFGPEALGQWNARHRHILSLVFH